MSGDLRARMRTFYQTSREYKRLLDAHGEPYLAPYVRLVFHYTSAGGRLLELGSGNGVASRMLAEGGYRVVGTDVSAMFLSEASEWIHERLAYVVCDGLQLPFPDASFDVVCSNEYVEHVPDVLLALEEMRRVTAPGGKVVIVGPNLLSPFVGLREAKLHLLGKKESLVWTRTFGEALCHAFRSYRLLVRKRPRREPEFLYRIPQLEDRVIGGDNDSVYLANPVDLEQYFRGWGWRVLAVAAGVGWRGRWIARWFPYGSPNLCVVAEKPSFAQETSEKTAFAL